MKSECSSPWARLHGGLIFLAPDSRMHRMVGITIYYSTYIGCAVPKFNPALFLSNSYFSVYSNCATSLFVILKETFTWDAVLQCNIPILLKLFKYPVWSLWNSMPRGSPLLAPIGIYIFLHSDITVWPHISTCSCEEKGHVSLCMCVLLPNFLCSGCENGLVGSCLWKR